MNTIKAIKERRSIMPDQFIDKEISDETIDLILDSANWAPTHKKTEPWRFKVLKGDSQANLGVFLANKFKETSIKYSEFKFNKFKNNSIKAGAIIIICMQRDLKKIIPEWEEIAAVSMAVQNIWLTATDLGIGGFWSSPKLIKYINEFTALGEGERCLGFFYLGHYDKSLIEKRIPGPIQEKVIKLYKFKESI